MIVDLYDAANAPLAKGDGGEPDLTRQSADATLEIMYFMASKIDGSDTSPEAGRRDAWAKTVAAAYGGMPAEQKQAAGRDAGDVGRPPGGAGPSCRPTGEADGRAVELAGPDPGRAGRPAEGGVEAFGKALGQYAMEQQMKVISAGTSCDGPTTSGSRR